MQKVIVRIDWYTKIVLTLITALLAGLLVKPYVVSKPVEAYNQEPMPVTIKKIDISLLDEPTPLHQSAIPVKVTNGVMVTGNVDAYITGARQPFVVVNWEEKDKYEFFEKLRKKGLIRGGGRQ